MEYIGDGKLFVLVITLAAKRSLAAVRKIRPLSVGSAFGAAARMHFNFYFVYLTLSIAPATRKTLSGKRISSSATRRDRAGRHAATVVIVCRISCACGITCG